MEEVPTEEPEQVAHAEEPVAQLYLSTPQPRLEALEGGHMTPIVEQGSSMRGWVYRHIELGAHYVVLSVFFGTCAAPSAAHRVDDARQKHGGTPTARRTGPMARHQLPRAGLPYWSGTPPVP